jgi:hypothetical protein
MLTKTVVRAKPNTRSLVSNSLIMLASRLAQLQLHLAHRALLNELTFGF